ncbi:hypothetical protein DAI22_12g118100 [Oryza sativa Japonica Group]|nr:hypothetical protein DAI22_12g118100 [Oryza sativa Japonica Group]
MLVASFGIVLDIMPSSFYRKTRVIRIQYCTTSWSLMFCSVAVLHSRVSAVCIAY